MTKELNDSLLSLIFLLRLGVTFWLLDWITRTLATIFITLTLRMRK